LEGGERPLLQVYLQELGGFFTQLRSRSGALLRSQRFSVVGFLHVAFDRGEAHAEVAGRLALGDPTSYSSDYLLSKVFGITINAAMLSSVHLCCNVLKTFSVKVDDTTAPTISGMSSDMNVIATTSSGATVTYTSPTALDLMDGSLSVACQPASGSTFALGETTVSYSATDSRNNSDTKAFKVDVAYAWSGCCSPPGPATKSS